MLEHFQRQAEKEELKTKLQQLLDESSPDTEDVFKALKDQLGKEDQAKLEEMLKQGKAKLPYKSWKVKISPDLYENVNLKIFSR